MPPLGAEEVGGGGQPGLDDKTAGWLASLFGGCGVLVGRDPQAGEVLVDVGAVRGDGGGADGFGDAGVHTQPARRTTLAITLGFVAIDWSGCSWIGSEDFDES